MGQPGLLTPVDVMKADWLSKRGGVTAVKKSSAASPSDSGSKPAAPKIDVRTTKDIPEYIVDPGTKTTYLRGKFLGKGGFARVHELTDLTTSQVYAGKIIPKSRLTKPHQRDKILREIDLHRQLQHKNVVRFHHFFEDEQNAYIILENCPKKSLVHILKNRKFLTEPEVRYFMLQLAEGVRYTHNQGVIHRDLKLGNMFLSEDMEMKIGDFGLATHVANIVKTGKKFTVCGTPNYIAPEVLNMQGHSFAADVWAMGCIMYAMLVGQPPFETTTLNETYYRITANKYSIPSSMSEAARHLVIKMLQCKPCDRPSLPEIIQHKFFIAGYLPNSLPTTCCVTVPKFPFAASLMKRPADNICSQEQIDKLANCIQDLQLNTKSQKSELPKIQPKIDPPPVSPKKDKCFPLSFRQKLTNVLCPDKAKKVKPVCHSQVMYTMVQNALESIPLECESNPVPLPENLTPFITKWIDYSNKYGFGFQLSDHSIGVIFNDSTRMSLCSNRRRVEFHDRFGKMSSYSHSSIPSHLEESFILLNFFVQYMDENLTEGGELESKDLVKKKRPVPHMKRWLRSSNAAIMQLSTGTLQINFFKDHTKIVINADGLVMYINEERHSVTFSLAQLCQQGCQPGIRSRLQYAAAVLQDFAQLEGETS